MGRDVYAIRVNMPMDVTAVLLCEKEMSVDAVVDKALLQLKNSMGIALPKAAVKVLAEEKLLDLKAALASVPYINDCIAQKKGSPNLTIQCDAPELQDVDVDDDAPEDWDINSDPQWVAVEEIQSAVAASLPPVPLPPVAVPPATNLQRPRSVNLPSTISLPPPISDPPKHPLASVTAGAAGDRPAAANAKPAAAATSGAPASGSSAAAATPSVAASTPATVTPVAAATSAAGGEAGSRGEEYRATLYGKGHTPAQVFSVEFVFPGEVKFLWDFSGDSTINQIKEDLWRLKDSINAADLKEPELYCLKFRARQGEIVELFDEQQLLQNVSMMPDWKARGARPSFVVDFKKKAISKQEQLFNMKIGNLIGFGLYQFDYLKDQEVDTFRRRAERVRREALRNRDPLQYLVEPIVERFPASETVLRMAPNGKIKMRLHLTFKNMDKTLLADVNDTPRQVIEKFIPKNKMNLPENCTADDFVLKVCGMSDYLAGDHKMIDFRFVRKCVLKEETVNLSLVAISSLNLNLRDYQEESDVIEDSDATTASHAQLTSEGREPSSIRNISFWDISRAFRVQIVGGENFSVGNVESLYVELGLFHGGQPLCPVKKSPQVRSSGYPRWETYINFEVATFNLPRATRLCLTVYGRWNAKKPMSQDKENDVYPLGWVNLLLMDYKGVLRQGLVKLNLWPGERSNPIGCCISNPKALESAALYLRFDSYTHPVIFPTDRYENEYKEYNKMLPPPTNDQDAVLLERIVTSDPLTKLSDKATALVWMYRFHCLRRPEALAKVLLSARWNLLEDVVEVRKLLLSWADLKPEVALELLDANFADEHVRAYAVSRLELLSDDQVVDYLVQLIQVLKYEPYHDNALSRFLLKRALRSKRVGHHFFWHLKAEMEQPEVSVRFALLLEGYLRGSPLHTDELIKQNTVMQKLTETALAIKSVKGAAERKEVLVSRLSKLSLPDSFQLALNPRLEAKALIVEKCKFMDSKKLPLWLVFENMDPIGKPVYIMFKSGDDLRQDMLTLQMISIMDKLWQQANLDLRMLPYGCISTGNEIGMIELVLNAETVSNIQQAYGGSTAAFRDTPLQEWIRAQNPADEDYEKAVETFVLSCAGYCVATYILGIGDRHNDNIMVTKSGHLFHIDFGHFLGNIKRKFGIKRERAPFVLTPDFVYVMGSKSSERFARFQDICCQAYLILRRNAYMFINLFAMMLSTGIPELKSTEDIYYLRDALCLDKTEEEASQEFRNLIFESLRLGWSTQLNWWIHNLAHAR